MKRSIPIARLAALLAVAAFTAPSAALSDTFVSGNITGTWSPSGGRYIVTGNCTVPGGQTLTIEPGCEIIIGQSLEIAVNGRILADGTATQRIKFRGANPTLFWNRIYVYNPSGDSRFVNCDFSDASSAALFFLVDSSAILAPHIISCSFSNCTTRCIHGFAYGYWEPHKPAFDGVIYNCVFSDSENGVLIEIYGRFYLSYPNPQGRTNSIVANNIFHNIPGAALQFYSKSVYDESYKSSPQFLNNIFVGCGKAIERAGDLSSLQNDVAGYNCFHSNTANFTGYPAGIHGTISGVNTNGTPCDLIYNIFEDPQFDDPDTFSLTATSPCIDAGSPAGAYLDTHHPPSQGSAVNDIGIYGGPYAANSLVTNAYNGSEEFMLTARMFCGVTIYPTTPGTCRIDYTNDLTSENWTQGINVDLDAAPYTWIDYETPNNSARFYRAVLLSPGP